MAETTTAQAAIDNAIRILQFAEQETANPAYSESLVRIAEAWTQVATLLRDGLD